MMQDSAFHSEKNLIRKVALLFTIPCAILSIMLATTGLMSVSFTPLFFQYDYVLFGVIYVTYFFGLYLSWQIHGKLLPFGLFVIHLLSVFTFVFVSQAEWLGYLSVISLMATSISNQYFRVGSFICNEDCGV